MIQPYVDCVRNLIACPHMLISRMSTYIDVLSLHSRGYNVQKIFYVSDRDEQDHATSDSRSRFIDHSKNFKKITNSGQTILYQKEDLNLLVFSSDDFARCM